MAGEGAVAGDEGVAGDGGLAGDGGVAGDGIVAGEREVDAKWQLPGWVMSLTDLSDASTRAYETGVLSFVTWAQRAGIDGPTAVSRLVLRRYLAYLTTRNYAAPIGGAAGLGVEALLRLAAQARGAGRRPHRVPLSAFWRVPAPSGVVAFRTGSPPGRATGEGDRGARTSAASRRRRSGAPVRQRPAGQRAVRSFAGGR